MKKWPILLAVICGLGFVLGLVHLFQLRFQTGDNYARYSSLRADPLGTKALFESLDSLVVTHRNFRPLTKLGDGRNSTLLYLGARRKSIDLEPAQFRALETFVRTGGRLVISLAPPTSPFDALRTSSTSSRRVGTTPPPAGTNQPASSPPPGAAGQQTAPGFSPVSKHGTIEDRWGFAIGSSPRPEEPMEAHRSMSASADPSTPLPSSLSLHSPYWFGELDPAWRTLYVREVGTNHYPVILERPVGQGAVVLCTDSFPFSNEALRYDRHSALLAYLIGASGQVYFDETHLGTRENPGLAALARRYRLGGVFLALAVLALLFIWKNTAVFLPPYAEQVALEQGNVVAGRDSASGFVNLLRRNIPPADILAVCLEQWNLHSADGRRPARAKLAAMQEIIDAENQLEPKQRHPVGTYRKFCEILSRRT